MYIENLGYCFFLHTYFEDGFQGVKNNSLEAIFKWWTQSLFDNFWHGEGMSSWNNNVHSLNEHEWIQAFLSLHGFECKDIHAINNITEAVSSKLRFRILKHHIVAMGEIPTGVLAELLKRNAHGLTDLYHNGSEVVIKSKEAFSEFGQMVSDADLLTLRLRKKLTRRHGPGHFDTRYKKLKYISVRSNN